MRQVVSRTLRRVIRREELWNGNREPLRNLWAWDSYESIIRWAWTHQRKYGEGLASALWGRFFAPTAFVRLRSHDEAKRWLSGLYPPAGPTVTVQRRDVRRSKKPGDTT